MVVLLVGLKVARQIGDALGEEGNLYLWRTGVTFAGGMGLHEFLLAFCSHSHVSVSL